MRKFKLTNGRGEEYDLMRREHFFHKPTGLGAENKSDFLRAGSDWIRIRTEPSQKKIGGEMVFRDYVLYADFIAFCAYEPLFFWYCPKDEWYYLECELTSIVKTEIDLCRRLFCPVAFTGFGAWRGRVTYQRAVGEVGNAKRYPYRYNYQYAGGAIGVINISNAGTVPAPVTLRVFGPCDNPRWSLTQGGETITTGRVFEHVTVNELLLVDPNPRSISIAVYSAVDLSPVRDAYNNSDFSTARFLYAPPGNSSISITHVGSGAVRAEAEVMRLADSV